MMRRTGKPFRRQLEGELGSDDHKLLYELKEEGFTDYYATAMMGDKAPSGFVTYATHRAGGFTDLDIAKFDTFALFVAPTVDTVNRRRIATTLLDTYIGHRAGERVLDGHISAATASRSARPSGIPTCATSPAERRPARRPDDRNPEHLFRVVGDAIMARGGEVLQFIGDAVLAIFECEPNEEDTRRACRVAYDAAQEALSKIGERNAARRAAMLPRDSLRHRPACGRRDLRQCGIGRAAGFQRGGAGGQSDGAAGDPVETGAGAVAAVFRLRRLRRSAALVGGARSKCAACARCRKSSPPPTLSKVRSCRADRHGFAAGAALNRRGGP